MWCALHQTPDGYWTDFEGMAASYADTGKVDAWDSSAALFLAVAGRYRQAGGTSAPAVAQAVTRARACIEKITDADGLTWATPTYKVKFLMDNVEVCAGLRAAATQESTARADRIARRLADFWQPAKSRFAFALHANGTFAGGFDKPYPHGLAQLYGIAFIQPYAAAWAAVNRAFQPEAGPAAACGAEWWLAAAARIGEDEARLWRARVAAETATFSPQRTYLHRYALSALALLEGGEWLSGPAGPEKGNRP